MKPLSPITVTALLAAAVTLPSLALEKPAPPAAEKHLRVLSSADEREIPKETVAFLGVEVAPAPEALTAQLGLKRGFGLVVTHLVPDSPAGAVLQPNDLLTKLDDQLLVDQRQLSVLVRSHSEGDEVALTLLRSGKEQTVKVKLAKRDVPRMTYFERRLTGPGWMGGPADLREQLEAAGLPSHGREEVNRVMRIIEREDGPDGPPDVIVQHGGDLPRHLSIMAPQRSVLVFKDDVGAVEMRRDGGKRILEVRGKDGAVSFSGEVTTPEQRAKLTPEVLGRLEKVESMDQLEVEPKGDFPIEERLVLPGTKRDI